MEIIYDPYRPVSMGSFDWSDLSSGYISLTFDRASPLFHRLLTCNHPLTCHHMLNCAEIHRSLARRNSHLIPVEIASEIFLYTVQADPPSKANLMLVCRDWRDIMLSTPGIHSRLGIYRWTRKRDVERFGKRWLLDVTVDMRGYDPEIDDWRDRHIDIDPVEFHACFMAAAEAASRVRSLALLSLPPPGEYKDLQIMHPLHHLESFKLATSCKLGNFLEPLLNAITTSVTPRFTVMEVFHPDAALYLLQPAHFQIFSSLTTLRLICRKMQNPVDVLPSLHKLEIFEADHLFLPIYPPGVDLPLVQTLRILHLKSVSVQWMAGQIFPALERCSIIFPDRDDAIQSVYMPSCSILKYDSNNLGYFHIPHLERLEIKCGQWRTWRGNLQLAALHPIFATQSLTCLHLEIKCSERLLVSMLRLVPALEELCMRLSSPHALSSAFFRAFAAGGPNACAGPSGHTTTPLGRKLRMLHVHYKRWLRGQERHTLFPAFGAVVASHPSKEQKFSFRLGLGEGRGLQEWNVHEPVERLDFGDSERTFVGVSSPYGIVPLTRVDDGDTFHDHLDALTHPLLCEELEYITTDIRVNLPIDHLFSFHSLKEVRMIRLGLYMEPGTRSSLNAPLFHTLQVLSVLSIPSSLFAGQTFHKLERYKERGIFAVNWRDDEPNPGQGPLTEMPVCTKLVASLSTLATLKLPQILELCVRIEGEYDHIWENHIAVNANLSGLKLLHLLHLRNLPSISVIKILGLLPALEYLIIGGYCQLSPCVDFFEAFVPTNVPGPSGLNESSWEGQISGVVCPRLESLQIEGIRLTEQAMLVPILKDIVTLRGIIGCPLKSFTFCDDLYSESPQMWQLIGRDQSFTVEEVVPAEIFQLSI